MNGAGPIAVPTERVSPVGAVTNCSCTGAAAICTDVVAWSPPGSVAVNWNSRNDGYSWSGAMTVPPATPGYSWIGWVWQAVGVTQWWRISDQRRAAGPRAPLSASLAPPENAMTSPTPQRAVAIGAEMVGCGACCRE